MKQVFDTIEISGGNVINQVELREKQGDRTVMIFEDVQANRALSEEAKVALERSHVAQ